MADEKKGGEIIEFRPDKKLQEVNAKDQSAYSQETSGSGSGSGGGKPPSNGFVARYLDMNLLNRIYKSFPMDKADDKYMKELTENFPNEQGAFVISKKPYMTQSYIPQVEGFLEYPVKNEFGTGFSDEGYRQRRKAFVWCSSLSPYSRQLQFWQDAYKFSQLIEKDIEEVGKEVEKKEEEFFSYFGFRPADLNDEKKRKEIEEKHGEEIIERAERWIEENLKELRELAEKKRKDWLAFANIMEAKEELQKQFNKEMNKLREEALESYAQEFRRLLRIFDSVPNSPTAIEEKEKVIDLIEKPLDRAIIGVAEYYERSPSQHVYEIDIDEDESLKNLLKSLVGEKKLKDVKTLWNDVYRPLLEITPDETGERRHLTRAFKQHLVVNAVLLDSLERSGNRIMEIYDETEKKLKNEIQETVRQIGEVEGDENLKNFVLMEKIGEDGRPYSSLLNAVVEKAEREYKELIKDRKNFLDDETNRRMTLYKNLIDLYEDLQRIREEREQFHDSASRLIERGVILNTEQFGIEGNTYEAIVESIKKRTAVGKAVEAYRRKLLAEGKTEIDYKAIKKELESRKLPYREYEDTVNELKRHAREVYTIEGKLRDMKESLIDTAAKKYNLDLLVEKLVKGKIPVSVFRDRNTLALLLGEDPTSNLVDSLSRVAEVVKERKLDDMFKRLPLNTSEYLQMLREARTIEYSRNLLSRLKPFGYRWHDRLKEWAEDLEQDGRTREAKLLRGVAPALYGFSVAVGGFNATLINCVEMAHFPSDTGLDVRASARVRQCMEKYFGDIARAEHQWRSVSSQIASTNPVNIFRSPYLLFASYMEILRGMQGAFWRSHYNYFNQELAREARELIYSAPDNLDERIKERLYEITGVRLDVKPLSHLTATEIEDRITEPAKEGEKFLRSWDRLLNFRENLQKINGFLTSLDNYTVEEAKEVLKKEILSLLPENMAKELKNKLPTFESTADIKSYFTENVTENKLFEGYRDEIRQMRGITSYISEKSVRLREKIGELFSDKPADKLIETMREIDKDVRKAVKEFMQNNELKVVVKGDNDMVFVATINANTLRRLGDDEILDRIANAKNKSEARAILLHHIGLDESVIKKELESGRLRNGQEYNITWKNVANAMAAKSVQQSEYEREREFREWRRSRGW